MEREAELLSLDIAAKEIGVKQETLYRAVKRGRLPGKKIGPRAWTVTRQALYEWRDNPENHRRGPKRKKSK